MCYSSYNNKLNLNVDETECEYFTFSLYSFQSLYHETVKLNFKLLKSFSHFLLIFFPKFYVFELRFVYQYLRFP